MLEFIKSMVDINILDSILCLIIDNDEHSLQLRNDINRQREFLQKTNQVWERNSTRMLQWSGEETNFGSEQIPEIRTITSQEWLKFFESFSASFSSFPRFKIIKCIITSVLCIIFNY